MHCRNYLTGVEVRSSPLLVSLLASMHRWCTLQQVLRKLRQYSEVSILRVFSLLLRHTLIVEKNSTQAIQEEKLASWDPWGVEARFFHFLTKRAYVDQPEVVVKSGHNMVRRIPLPAAPKRYPHAGEFRLPKTLPHSDSEFVQVLQARRTHRQFRPGKVPLDKISTLLRLTWGISGYFRYRGVGLVTLKTSPSGGARHPLEVYLWALRVAGLPRGLYHYRSDVHRLEQLRERTNPYHVAKLCAGQDWIADCCACFVMTGVFQRTMWRYPSSRAYRVVFLEAGHFCQTFCLVATWLGLAPFCSAALLDDEIEKEIGLDGATESVLYAASVGLKI